MLVEEYIAPATQIQVVFAHGRFDVWVVLQGFHPALPTYRIIREGPATQGFDHARDPKCEGSYENVDESQTAAEEERPLYMVKENI